MYNKLILILGVLCCFLETLHAQYDDTELETFVVTAQYEKTSKDKAVNKIKVISRKKIDALAAVNLGDVLKNELNVRLSQDNVLGSFMSLQGISGQNVKILIDGIPIIGRLDGSIDVSQINLNNVERIEIVEGPLSVNYGTDALAGTINLISKNKKSDGISYNVNSYYESIGQYNFDGSINYKLNNNQIKFSGGRNLFDGWSRNDPFFQFPKSRLADTLRAKPWNPKEQLFSNFEYLYSKDSTIIRSYFNYFDEEITNRGNPRYPYYETAFDDYYNTWRKDIGIDFKKKLKSSGEIKILAAYNHYKRIKLKYRKDLTTLDQQLTQNQGDQDTSKFDLIISRGTYSKLNGDIDFQIGYEINIESSLGKRIEGNTQKQSNYAVFGSVKYNPITNLVIMPALRLAYNSTYEAPPIPSLNVKYNLGDLIFRGSYAKGFRAPSLKELYFYFVDINHNIVGNSDLKEEKSNNIIADISWKKMNPNCIINIDGGFFFNDINNLIDLALSDSSSQQFSYINIGNFKTIGGKINTAIKFEKLNLDIGFARVGRYNNLSESYNISKFNYSPEFRSNIIYKWSKFGLQLSAFYKYTGSTMRFNLNAEEEITESTMASFNMFDANITKTFNKKDVFADKFVVEWSIGLKNIFDVQSVASTGNSGGVHSVAANSLPVSWGRSVFSSFKIKFN